MTAYTATCPDCAQERIVTNKRLVTSRCVPCARVARKAALAAQRALGATRQCGHEESDVVVRSDGKRYCLPCKKARDRARDYSLSTANRVSLPLPPPPTTPRWNEGGACFGMNTNLFYPERGESPNPAKAVCGGCPVRGQCLAWAFAAHEAHGIWGGKTPQERVALKRWVA